MLLKHLTNIYLLRRNDVTNIYEYKMLTFAMLTTLRLLMLTRRRFNYDYGKNNTKLKSCIKQQS